MSPKELLNLRQLSKEGDCLSVWEEDKSYLEFCQKKKKKKNNLAPLSMEDQN